MTGRPPGEVTGAAYNSARGNPEESTMFRIGSEEQKWVPGKQAGVERAVLWEVEGGGRTSLIRVAKGATIEMHGHLGKEEVYMVSGRIRVGEHELSAGDYHHTSLGERHDLEAFEDSMFFAVTEKVIPGR
jgi:quercetin dioxygenase-like cupin family protein